mmetsp:Transcript_8830/g.36087  ORF Transcript_8830/g.36087 Transcript_8830/m.36087 type:complete len:414 (+) Transcript_8830:1287-2528(+)
MESAQARHALAKTRPICRRSWCSWMRSLMQWKNRSRPSRSPRMPRSASTKTSSRWSFPSRPRSSSPRRCSASSSSSSPRCRATRATRAVSQTPCRPSSTSSSRGSWSLCARAIPGRAPQPFRRRSEGPTVHLPQKLPQKGPRLHFWSRSWLMRTAPHWAMKRWPSRSSLPSWRACALAKAALRRSWRRRSTHRSRGGRRWKRGGRSNAKHWRQLRGCLIRSAQSSRGHVRKMTRSNRSSMRVACLQPRCRTLLGQKRQGSTQKSRPSAIAQSIWWQSWVSRRRSATSRPMCRRAKHALTTASPRKTSSSLAGTIDRAAQRDGRLILIGPTTVVTWCSPHPPRPQWHRPTRGTNTRTRRWPDWRRQAPSSRLARMTAARAFRRSCMAAMPLLRGAALGRTVASMQTLTALTLSW